MTMKGAAQLVLAASEQGSAAWYAAALAATASVVAAVLAYRSNSKATRVEYGASLRDDQRELIKELRADNAEQRARLTDQGHELHVARGQMEAQEAKFQRQSRRIAALESALRTAGIPVPKS